MDNMQQFIGKKNLTVSEAMQQIDRNSSGILFIVDDQEHLVGCLTDGDVRRFLLAGGKMSALALEAANKTPKFAKNENEARALYDKRNYVVIPVLNEEGIVIDLFAGESGIQKKKSGMI